jgi:glucan 1,3-beta-glucosidase
MRSGVSRQATVSRDSTTNATTQQLQTVGAAATFPDGYWLNDLSGKGIAAFNSNPGAYKVFRNVKDYGAVGE